MSQISVQVRLRPIRFAFMVRPDDGKHALEIFRVNTCLWGGRFNPIIPYFKKVPRWWDRHPHHFETAAQIINGYLDFFEPDFIIEAESGLSNGLGFDKERVLPLSSLLERESDINRNGYGLSVIGLYRDLYRTVYQFARRHEHDLIDAVPAKHSYGSFCACFFGAFPVEPELEYFKQAFNDAFAPKTVSINGESLADLYRSGFTSAFRIGSSKIEIDHHDYHSDPALFVMDATEPRDLIDFWNLRAIYRQVIPVPVQWLGDLSEFCKEFILKNYRHSHVNPNTMLGTSVIFSRSIQSNNIKQLLIDFFRVDIPKAFSYQDWYPSIWSPSPEYTIRKMRPTLSSSTKKFDVPITGDKPGVSFDCLHPDFADEYGSKIRWANVVRFRDWTSKDQIATIFPCDYKNPSYPKRGIDAIIPTTEGLVFFPQYKNSSQWWTLTDGSKAISDWLETQGIKAVQSDAGRATQQIIQTLGGFRSLSSLAHVDIVKYLDKISRRPILRSAHIHEFKDKIQSAVKDDFWRGGCFETLVERSAVELGLEVKCSKCSSWSWFSLKQLDYQLTCSLCMQQFGFPIINPKSEANVKWAYRLIGPFALPNYANGGYAASLSIRFFSAILGENDRVGVTWSVGQELDIAKEKFEADYILWYQRKEILGNDYPTELIFGEAKSFGKSADGKAHRGNAFEAKDIERMKRLAVRFPGSILVFSTMKQAFGLSQDEVSRIARLAEWGREYISGERQTRAPVIVLTGTELFASHSLEDAWRKAGGKHGQFTNGLAWAENLRILADLTQQLYLDLPSYRTWLETKKTKKNSRKTIRPSSGIEET